MKGLDDFDGKLYRRSVGIGWVRGSVCCGAFVLDTEPEVTD